MHVEKLDSDKIEHFLANRIPRTFGTVLVHFVDVVVLAIGVPVAVLVEVVD